MNFLKKFYTFFNSWTGTIIFVLLVIFFFVQAFIIPSGSMKNSLLVGEMLFVKKFSYGIPTPHIPWLEIPILPDFDDDGHLISGDGPKRGDIVVFRYPHDEKIHFVKRCVAKGNDRVIYANKTLYVSMSEGEDFMRENYPKDDLIKLGGRLFVKEPYKQKGIHYEEQVNMDDLIEKYALLGQFAMTKINLKELGNAYVFDVPENEYFMMGDNRDFSSDSRFWGSVPYKLIVGQPWFVYMSFDKNYNIRWERIGRFVDSLENEEKFIKDDDSGDTLS
ncbi:signal peptidase I [Campylobacter upsaliensis]|mgnify:FL=1|uniref:Signal peptidase I n=2 Tax=Campylobacter upsaliensis TaxID=28080 RepID=A0A828QWL8_CAMUP|nr:MULTISPECIES: signal peptidase I [Campylobacter]EAB5282233.1 signal peptidase I [Campylobacter upsaliensis]EAH4720552.1 signal peptidase I [Campylobacter upsaliensis]EAH5218031.1 signal peptidase I [Campylobacter upsaliensis]EAH5545633.1 signal peptidase I [Campylobacter upsaliensis]EAH5676912.1 signal peptidase I [Campylobacter upsaliensis]